MAKIIQIDSHPSYAQHSAGPVTPQRRNPLLIPGEDPAEFDALVADLLDTWKPRDTAERQHVDMLVTDSWRLNRLLEAEAQLWADAKDLESLSLTLDRVGRMIDRIQRSIRQTTRDLDRLIALRAKSEAKAEKSAKAPHREVTEQSQFPTPLQREQANWRKQIE